MNAIETLLEAAEYIERREREAKAEHGYASTFRYAEELRTPCKRPKPKKSQGNRTSHNELEKNRRAHLRNCLEKLKDIVPLGPEASRHTTLGLLTKAKRFIKNLEDKERKHASYKEQLCREQRYLRRRVDQLSLHFAMSKRRSISECSSSTVSSYHSSASLSSSAPSPISESDEVDVIGYTTSASSSSSSSSSGGGGVCVGTGLTRFRRGAHSDTDTDRSSVLSAASTSSDSGVATSASRLTLCDVSSPGAL